MIPVPGYYPISFSISFLQDSLTQRKIMIILCHNSCNHNRKNPKHHQTRRDGLSMIIKNPMSFSRIYKAQGLYVGREAKTEEVRVMTKNSVRVKSRCQGNVGGDSDKMM